MTHLFSLDATKFEDLIRIVFVVRTSYTWLTDIFTPWLQPRLVALVDRVDLLPSQLRSPEDSVSLPSSLVPSMVTSETSWTAAKALQDPADSITEARNRVSLWITQTQYNSSNEDLSITGA